MKNTFFEEQNLPTLAERDLACDFAVVGGGLAGLCAAVAAARNGLHTVLLQDRPVLGGNASSEIRMGIGGHTGTGLLEELLLENLYRNPGLRFTVWDDVMYGFARREPNLTVLLNTPVISVKTEANRIVSVTGFHLQEYARIEVTAHCFADCSGDGILRLSGAEFMRGRESREEFGEPDAREVHDSCTMGNSILFQLRKCTRHVPFRAPEWAYHYTDKTIPARPLELERNNFWWIELGGTQDTIRDSDKIRDELYKVAYGVWEYLKNHPDGRGRNYELAWIGALPGKRESIRFVGEHVLTQNDIAEDSSGTFPDAVARGAWGMDDHHPEGVNYPGWPNRNLRIHKRFHIPYRSLYSGNIENLFFAGRQISATHLAMSATRVMGTCAALGQAVGTAAAVALRHHCFPHEVFCSHLAELQQLLLKQDQDIPGIPINYPPLTKRGRVSHEVLRDGKETESAHALELLPGEACGYRFDTEEKIAEVRLVFDSDVTDPKRLRCFEPESEYRTLPDCLPKEIVLEVYQNNRWRHWQTIRENHRRLLILPGPDEPCRGIQMKLLLSWGGGPGRICSFSVE